MDKVMQVIENDDKPSQAQAMVQMIERAALNPDVDIVKMERLLDMQERILNREAESAFHSAMADMQAELPTIEENGLIKVNNQVRSKYARFEDINRTCKPILQKYGFAISFRISTANEKITVTGILSHRQGHCERTSMDFPADTSGSKNNVQAMGSSVSYGRRYVMMALLNLTTGEDDDDGQAAGTTPMTDQQLASLKNLMQEVNANTVKFCEHFGILHIAMLPAEKYMEAIAMLNERRARQAKK